MTLAPVLRTERLLLRMPMLEDWPPFAEILVSERAKFMGGPYTQEAAWGVFCHGIALWSLYGMGNLSIVEVETGACVGQVEINQGPRFPEAELGWQLAPAAEGLGYAFEAARALRDWAFEERGVASLVSYIDPENKRSIDLAVRLGAELDDSAVPQDPGDVVFRHWAPQI